MRSVEVVQQMIEWLEMNVEGQPTLQNVSAAVGYSPWYCSCMFHDITGVTIKAYVTGRRLALATEAIRDTQGRILDKMAHPIVTAHTAGWKKTGEKMVYFYGTGVPLDYAGEIPKGFEVKELPRAINWCFPILYLVL